MYLSFIIDLVKKGDLIKVSCGSDYFVGKVVKVTEELLAIRLDSDSSVKIIKDENITDVELDKSQDVSQKPQRRAMHVIREFNIGLGTLTDFLQKNGYDNLQLNPSSRIPDEAYDLISKAYAKDKEMDKTAQQTDLASIFDVLLNKTENESSEKDLDTSSQENITLDAKDNYDASTIDFNRIHLYLENLKEELSETDRELAFEANAYVNSADKNTLVISSPENSEEVASMNTVIERSLHQDLSSIPTGTTLPVVAYRDGNILPDKITLILSPNSISGILRILEASVTEKHYASTKLLCYFLRSHINSPRSKSSISSIIGVLRKIDPFIVNSQKNISEGRKQEGVSIAKSLKTINYYINQGNIEEAIKEIDKSLSSSNIDEKHKSNLLLMKAQAFSSKTDYEKAKAAYIELIQFNVSRNEKSPRNLSHLCTELARLQILTKEDAKSIEDTILRALKYNPYNTYASTLLAQVQNRSSATVSTGEDKELLVDDEEASFSVSKMLDIDIKEYVYTNGDIISRGGKPTAAIAKSILKEAKQTRDVDLSERYPIYLEAAKAFSELPIGSYDTQDYLEAVSYYAILKGNSLYLRFKQMQNEGTNDIGALTRIKDSACSYYIESLNLLSSITADRLLAILCNYLKLNISLHNIANNHKPLFSGQFNKIFFDCLKSTQKDLKRIAWLTVMAVGTASSNAWNQLNTIKGGTSGLSYAIKGSTDSYSLINECNNDDVDSTLAPGAFLKESFRRRKEKTKMLGDLLNDIIKLDLDVHLLGPITSIWNKTQKYEGLFLPTDLESKKVVDEILLILGPYNNRNQAERTNLLIQVQRKLEDQITFIRENTTFYGRTFFFPLFSKWKRTIQDILEDKISQMLPVLEVLPDPYYILEDENGKFVNLLVKNVGSSTAEGYEIVATTKDPNSNLVNKGKSTSTKEIAAGAHEGKRMNLPSQLQDKVSLEFEIEITAIYQSKPTEWRKYIFTVEKEPVSSLSEEDIMWNDSQITAGQMFKGREQILDNLSKHYLSIERDKPYILYGLTRTGKSSILKFLKKKLDDTKTVRISGKEYRIATFMWDLSVAGSYGNAKDMWQYLLYENTYEELDDYLPIEVYEQLNIPEYPRQKHLTDILAFLKKFLIYPIFFVDEFSFIKSLMDSGAMNAAFLQSLRQFSLEGRASFIFAGTYDIKKLIKDPKYGITGQLVNAVELQVNEIDSKSAEDLMNVMNDRLSFTREAINHIHMLSGDIPFFIQMICKYCGIYAVEKNRRHIGYPELETVIRILTCEEKPADKGSLVIGLPENRFQNNQYSPGDPKEVHAVISSIAYLNEGRINPRGVSLAELQQLWSEKHITDFRPRLADAINLLLEKKILTVKDDDDVPVYTISVDLFRRWWSANHQDIDLELSSAEEKVELSRI